MKQGKKPTREIKELISKQKVGKTYLNPDNWLYRKNSIGEITLIHRRTGKKIYLEQK
ncbi:hypothetical protein [Enterococcus sp. C76]|uniref:DUF6906 family protein n=1 Tax=Enterococcus sp. C76 TaxID=3231334 RepID=UPI0034A097A0